MKRTKSAHSSSGRHHRYRRILHSPFHISIAGIILLSIIIGVISYTQKLRAQGNDHFPSVTAKGKALSSASDRILIRFKPSVSASKKETLYAKYNVKKKSGIGNTGVDIVSVPTGKAPKQFADTLKRDEKNSILFAETDDLVTPQEIPNDPNYPSEWHLSKIMANDAWTLTKATGVTIGICDTGFDGSHQDLAGALLTDLGYNTVDNSTNWSPVLWHGTAVAGVAAGVTNNAYGIAGVAWGAKIIPVRISNSPDGGAYVSDAAECIAYSADHGAKAINLSYLMAQYDTIDAASSYAEGKGAVTVVAAGNNAIDPGWPDFGTFLAVSGTDENDNLASFSNYGAYIDLAAPAVNILAPYLGSFAYVNGTSFSAPIVTGTLALVYAAKPSVTPAEAKAILLQTADDLGAPGDDAQFGAGRVNAKKAIEYILGPLPPPTSTPTPVPPTPTPTPVPPTLTPTPTPINTPVPTSGPDITPPVVTITYPLNNSFLTRNVAITIQATATDNYFMKDVEFWVNNTIYCRDINYPYSCWWKVPPKRGVTYTIKAIATDLVGNTATTTARVTSK